uniref:Uncharacterized protein n=1 Tax=Anguilla anguilla TaxID=7936 RepID=A0A0E9SA10_ANGAN
MDALSLPICLHSDGLVNAPRMRRKVHIYWRTFSSVISLSWKTTIFISLIRNTCFAKRTHSHFCPAEHFFIAGHKQTL